jgi:hypothetical protein
MLNLVIDQEKVSFFLSKAINKKNPILFQIKNKKVSQKRPKKIKNK